MWWSASQGKNNQQIGNLALMHTVGLFAPWNWEARVSSSPSLLYARKDHLRVLLCLCPADVSMSCPSPFFLYFFLYLSLLSDDRWSSPYRTNCKWQPDSTMNFSLIVHYWPRILIGLLINVLGQLRSVRLITARSPPCWSKFLIFSDSLLRLFVDTSSRNWSLLGCPRDYLGIRVILFESLSFAAGTWTCVVWVLLEVVKSKSASGEFRTSFSRWSLTNRTLYHIQAVSILASWLVRYSWTVSHLL